MSHAVIETGGKQYRVTEGMTLEVEKLNAQPGSQILFDRVLMLGNGADVKVGRPLLEGVAVRAEVLAQLKDKKIWAFKYKRRKGYHRTVGHRRRLTRIRIQEIPSA